MIMSRYLPAMPALALVLLSGCAGESRLSRPPGPGKADLFIGLSGVNLPWLDYGWDLGECPWGEMPGGFHRKRERLEEQFAWMADHGIALCRVFLFCDFRTGLERDREGNILGLDDFVARDMETLLEVALEHRVRLLPVLVDYMIANGVREENGVPVGEYPEYIADPARRSQLLENALAPFIREYGLHEAVHAWDIINEPRFASAVDAGAMNAFIAGVAALFAAEAPGALVSVGNYHPDDLAIYGPGIGDFDQLHYYGYEPGPFGWGWDPGLPASKFSSRPILIGEMEPLEVAARLDRALAGGYAGVLFWSLNAGDGHDFRAVAGDYRAWVESRGRSRRSRVSRRTH